MIAGYHIVISAYGFWLPNDPRGSWSEAVAAWELFRFGPATKTTERRSVANVPHDRQLRIAAKAKLKRPAVTFTGLQARAVARGIGDYCQRRSVHVWACAILPEHMHLVVRRHKIRAEQLSIQFKGAASRWLAQEGIHPFGHLASPGERLPPCFSRGQWIVYLDHDDVLPAVRYVQENPVKEGKKRQRWSFITPPE